MIHIYFGLPASCKTVHASLQIVEALKQQRPVYTNMQASFFHDFSAKTLSYFSGLHFLHYWQTATFWQHIKPGSLVIIDDFDYAVFCYQMLDRRYNFFECWFEEHFFSGTDLILISDSLRCFDNFFYQEPLSCSVHKVVKPNWFCRFSAMSIPFLKTYSITSGKVDTFPHFDVSSRTFYSLQSTLSKISAFFEAKP